MTRLVRVAALVLALTSCLPAFADKASTAFKHGAEAEARDDFGQAYDFYKQAFDLKPNDIKYRAAYTRMRFYASAAHVRRGQQLRDQGKLDEALAEFQKGSAIDPSNFLAGQEAHRTELMIQKQQAGASPAVKPSDLSSLAEHAAGPVELRPISNALITL